MNILFLLQSFPTYGGISVVTTILANQFIKDGHNVTTASLWIRYPELKEQLDPSIDIYKLDYPVTSAKTIKNLRQIIIKKNIDILINQWGLPFKTTILCRKATKGTKCKIISVLHGSPYISKVLLSTRDKIENTQNVIVKTFYKGIYTLKEEIVKGSIRYNCKHNDQFIVLSESFIKPLMKFSKLKDSSNISAIGNPITVPVVFDESEIYQKKKQLLYVGRMDFENKRVNRILEAWECIYDEFKDWELILVGDGPHKDTLQKYVHQKKIERVQFKGFQKEPPIKYYKDASIFLLTSDLEGFGLVIVESMSYGVVPIVYGSYEAVFDIINPGISGFITSQPYNQAQTVEYIRMLIKNNDLRIKMGQQAMIDAKKFSLQSICKKWYDLFDKLLN